MCTCLSQQSTVEIVWIAGIVGSSERTERIIIARDLLGWHLLDSAKRCGNCSTFGSHFLNSVKHLSKFKDAEIVGSSETKRTCSIQEGCAIVALGNLHLGGVLSKLSDAELWRLWVVQRQRKLA